MAKIDKTISKNLDASSVSMVFRFVDNYLMAIKRPEGPSNDKVVNSVMDVFRPHAGRLKFTHECQDAIFLRFLDLKFKYSEHHACWLYQPRTKKELLSFDSSHPKLAKRALESSCLLVALEKPCHYTLRELWEAG